MYLLLPALTDVRCAVCGAPPDVIEVPAGSGRCYFVSFVDDISKGFASEHRLALLVFPWPMPDGGAELQLGADELDQAELQLGGNEYPLDQAELQLGAEELDSASLEFSGEDP